MAKSKKSSGRGKRKISLAAFFRKLWSKPELLERFSESPEGREEVLRQFNLSARHKKLIVEGCVRDLIAELAGVKTRSQTNTLISAVADLKCGHPECEAFIKAIKKRK